MKQKKLTQVKIPNFMDIFYEEKLKRQKARKEFWKKLFENILEFLAPVGIIAGCAIIICIIALIVTMMTNIINDTIAKEAFQKMVRKNLPTTYNTELIEKYYEVKYITNVVKVTNYVDNPNIKSILDYPKYFGWTNLNITNIIIDFNKIQFYTNGSSIIEPK